MALVLDETFATTFNAAFATKRVEGGTLNATWNSSLQAVNLNNTTLGQSIWDITSQPLRAAGEMEIELEYVSDSTGALAYRHAGLWAVAGLDPISQGIRCAHFLNVGGEWNVSDWQGGAWSQSAARSLPRGTMARFTTAGDKRILNLRWDMREGAGASRLSAEFRIDGALWGHSLAVFPSLRPGVFLYGCSVRLHSIKVWDAPEAPLLGMAAAGFEDRLSIVKYGVVGATNPRTHPLYPNVGRWGREFSGDGFIVGTVKRKDTPDAPAHCKVCLFKENSKILVAEVWSDAITGGYLFENIQRGVPYTVLSYYPTGAFRAVVADGQLAEPMP